MTAPGLITAVVAVLAVGAWLTAAYSAVRAWIVSERHPPYRALGWKRFYNWMGAIPFMPAEAMPHLRRLYFSVAVFFVAMIAAVFAGVVSARS